MKNISASFLVPLVLSIAFGYQSLAAGFEVSTQITELGLSSNGYRARLIALLLAKNLAKSELKKQCGEGSVLKKMKVTKERCEHRQKGPLYYLKRCTVHAKGWCKIDPDCQALPPYHELSDNQFIELEK